jgi:hypothetical protein
MFLLYRDKIENSTVIGHNEIKKKYLPLSTPRQRRISLITYILMSLYTVYTCIILKLEAREISLFVIANVVSLLSMIFIKIISKSVYELNHQNTYVLVDFINKSAKLVLFYYAIMKFIDSFEISQMDRILDFLQIVKDAIISKDTAAITTITNLFKSDVLPLVSLFASLLTFIPILIYFVIINIKMVCTVIIWITPGINALTYLYWLFKRHNIFKVYEVKDDETFDCQTRKINIKGYNLNMFFTKLVASLIIIAFIYVIITFAFEVNIIDLVKNFYSTLYDYILRILGFLTGYGYE